MSDTASSPIMAALEKFEAVEANLHKLESVWDEIEKLRPKGITFGSMPEYEDRVRSFSHLLDSLPKIDGWKPSAKPLDMNEIAQGRLDALEVDEVSAHVAVDDWMEEPARELREYRFRLNNQRRALIREALVSLIDQIDDDLRTLRSKVGEEEDDRPHRIDADHWTDLKNHVKQIDTLLGSSVQRPSRWGDMMRHIHFGYINDLEDIERMDWPDVKSGLRNSLYGKNEPLPVDVVDLADLVASKPTGPIATGLKWANLDDDKFERLMFSLISDTPGYENPEWLMKTRAPDRGRDLSVYRVTNDELSGVERHRVVIQCKHWLSKSVGSPDAAAATAQMAHWTNPKVDILTIATSGRFSADAVDWIEAHNAKGIVPKVQMWPESHLERLLAKRPGLIAEFGLR